MRWFAPPTFPGPKAAARGASESAATETRGDGYVELPSNPTTQAERETGGGSEGAARGTAHREAPAALGALSAALRWRGGLADDATEALLARDDGDLTRLRVPHATGPGSGAGAGGEGAGVYGVEEMSPLFAAPSDEERGLEIDGHASVPLAAAAGLASEPQGDRHAPMEVETFFSTMDIWGAVVNYCCCCCGVTALIISTLIAVSVVLAGILSEFPTHDNITNVTISPTPSPLFPTAAPSGNSTSSQQKDSDENYTTDSLFFFGVLFLFISFDRRPVLHGEERQWTKNDNIRLMSVSLILSTSACLEHSLLISEGEDEQSLPAWFMTPVRWIIFFVSFCVVLRLIMGAGVNAYRQYHRKQVWGAVDSWLMVVSMVLGAISAPHDEADGDKTFQELLMPLRWLGYSLVLFLLMQVIKFPIRYIVLPIIRSLGCPTALCRDIKEEPTLFGLLSLDPSDEQQRSLFDNDAVRAAVLKDPATAAKRHSFNVGQGQADHLHPLFMAVALGASPDVVSLLCDACPDAVNGTDRRGSKPLHTACAYGCPAQVVRVLAARDPSNLGHTDGWGHTPLHVASAMRAPSEDVVQFLIESYPPALSMKDGEGRTPLDLVRLYGAPPDVAQLYTCSEVNGCVNRDAVQSGREVMRRMLGLDSEPEPLPPEYLEYCTKGFSEDERIGEGAFGEVYEGVDRVLRRKFAVKRLRVKLAETVDANRAKRTFERELATLKHFRHPNIARLYAYFLSPNLHGHQCLVFELAANGSLHNFLRQSGLRKKLDWTRRIKIALDVARALEYLHKGMAGQVCLHRDVKSANICLRRDYTALLIDCGVSKMIPDNESNVTMTIMDSTVNRLQGSSGYICPMFAHTMKDYTSANEMFSLGVVLAELFTGTLQGSKVDGEEVNIFNWYSKDGAETRDIEKYADTSSGDWEMSAKHDFSCLSVSCISLNPIMRPKIQDIVKLLGKLSSKARPWFPGERNRITVLQSNPLVWKDSEGDFHAIEPLNFAKERDLLVRCMAESRRGIELIFDVATDDRLQAAVTKRCGCLHYSGHGHPEVLLFEDGEGGVHWLGEDKLYDSVHKEPFKFVFVSACHSGLMGRSLVRAGVPHVVCCRHEEEVMDEAAIKFMNTFYYALAEGYTVKAAFEKGKLAVSMRFNEEVDKFLLLPLDGDHDQPLFDAELLEWEDEKKVENFIPAPPQFFFGREVSMYKLIKMIISHRLVTLIGEDGVGCSSLASSVSHYIDDRKTTIQSIKSVYFVRLREGQDENSFGAFIKHLHQQLVAEGNAAKLQKEDIHNFSSAIIEALVGTRALVVFDGIDNKDHSYATFAKLMFEKTNTTKILLTSRDPIGFSSSSTEEQVFYLDPLDIGSTVKLFVKICPHAEGCNKLQNFLNDNESSDSDSSSDDNQRTNIYETLGGGIPARTICAAKEMSKEEYNNLF